MTYSTTSFPQETEDLGSSALAQDSVKAQDLANSVAVIPSLKSWKEWCRVAFHQAKNGRKIPTFRQARHPGVPARLKQMKVLSYPSILTSQFLTKMRKDSREEESHISRNKTPKQDRVSCSRTTKTTRVILPSRSKIEIIPWLTSDLRARSMMSDGEALFLRHWLNLFKNASRAKPYNTNQY